MDLLEIVQSAAVELGLQPPSAVVASTDPQTQQLYYLVNRTGRELQQNYEWTALQEQFIVNIGPPVSTTGNVTEGSAVITGIPDTSGITANLFVASGQYIPTSARVVSVDSSTQVTLDSECTGDATATDLTFAKDTYAFPDDFDRFTNRTQWDRTNHWELIGPDSPQIDQWHRSGIVTVGPRRHYRQIGIPPDALRLWPPPAIYDSPFEIVSEYITENWAQSALGVRKSKMTADTDVSLIDGNAIILGVKWRYFQIKQFDYAPLQQEYNDYCDRHFGQDGGAPTLSMVQGLQNPLLTSGNVQDGGFPGPGNPTS